VSARRSSGAKRARPAAAKPARTAAAKRARPAPARRGSDRGAAQRAATELCHDVLARQGVVRAEVGLAFGGDETLRELNRRYRGLDKATDVLSFTYEDRSDGRGRRHLAGDIVISVPRVFVQARRYRVSPGRELARLLIHGALHLCGHDHLRAAERTRMRALERAHLLQLGKTRELALTRLLLGWAPSVE
jgi:probable rRNA maturation factor